MIITQYKTKLQKNRLAALEPVVQYESEVDTIRSTSDARNVIEALRLEEENEENLVVICLSAAGKVIGLFVNSSGAHGACNFAVRDVCQKALLLNATSVIVAHNHPGGSLIASTEDIEATGTLKKALETIGLRLLDHFIVAGITGEITSLRETGVFN